MGAGAEPENETGAGARARGRDARLPVCEAVAAAALEGPVSAKLSLTSPGPLPSATAAEETLGAQNMTLAGALVKEKELSRSTS